MDAMMDATREVFRRFVESWRHASRRQRITWMGLLSAALCLFVVTSTLVAFSARPRPTVALVPTATSTVTVTATATATDTATATNTPLPPTATPVYKSVATVPAPPPPPVPTRPPATPTVGPATPTATPCAATYTGNNPSQDQIKQALDTAATTYHLPNNLLYAVAWQESRWHQDVASCDGGIGLMQIQYYSFDFINTQATQTDCGLGPTSYDVHTLQGNAMLGAKYLVYLSCFFEYWGNNTNAPTSVINPAPYTSAWYYKNVGLPYPDYSMTNSFCAANLNDSTQPWYKALPEGSGNAWSCPYQPQAGDATLLDISLSAYNEGADNVVNEGIENWWYVQGVEGWIPQFAAGTLPT